MDLKTFLKPTMEKLAVALVLFLFFVPTVSLICSAPCKILNGERYCSTASFVAEESAVSLAGRLLMGFSCGFTNIKLMGTPLLGIPIAYLVSCILVPIYQTFSKRKK